MKTINIEKYLKCDKEKVLVLDTETTGINKTKGKPITFNQEIIQITILNGYGSVLFSSYIRPKESKRWPLAEKINHITPKMVENAPYFSDVKAQIQSHFDKAKYIIGYNVNFDVKFVSSADIYIPPKAKLIDVLYVFKDYKKAFAVHTDNNKLISCAEHFGIPFDAHDSLNDAKATLECFNKIIDAYQSNNKAHDEEAKLARSVSPQEEKAEEKSGKKTNRIRISHFGRWNKIVYSFIIAFICLVIIGISPINIGEMDVASVKAIIQEATQGGAKTIALIVFIITFAYAIINAVRKIYKTIIGKISYIFRKVFQK